MKCFYHNDADGKCAGFWVHYRTRLAPNNETIDFVEMSYEKPFPMDTILPGEQIYIVDYSIMPDEMRELLKITQVSHGSIITRQRLNAIRTLSMMFAVSGMMELLDAC